MTETCVLCQTRQATAEDLCAHCDDWVRTYWALPDDARALVDRMFAVGQQAWTDEDTTALLKHPQGLLVYEFTFQHPEMTTR